MGFCACLNSIYLPLSLMRKVWNSVLSVAISQVVAQAKLAMSMRLALVKVNSYCHTTN